MLLLVASGSSAPYDYSLRATCMSALRDVSAQAFPALISFVFLICHVCELEQRLALPLNLCIYLTDRLCKQLLTLSTCKRDPFICDHKMVSP